MIQLHESALTSTLEGWLGHGRWTHLSAALDVPQVSREPRGEGRLGRGEIALALALGLLDDLCQRVPLAAAYVNECALEGRRFLFDHGAMRTVAAPSGNLPAGRRAIARLLEPLGYRQSRVYPLERLGMTGYVYTHLDDPESIPQYFVSELEPEHFGVPFQRAVHDLVSTSVDPLPPSTAGLLAELEAEGSLDARDAGRLLVLFLRAFGRHHREPTWNEYEAFAQESPEMAWIATEGHTFNHITDRVLDVSAVAAFQRALGRPVKRELEVSRTGRVIQTAFQANEVERLFRDERGYIARRVPGSFLEFISRERLEDGRLDLAFDAQNAQGIFKMTATEKEAC